MFKLSGNTPFVNIRSYENSKTKKKLTPDVLLALKIWNLDLESSLNLKKSQSKYYGQKFNC